MDPITHCLAGAMVAKSATIDQNFSKDQNRIWFWSLVIAAEFPDMDVFYHLTPLARDIFFFHRGFTHSILGAVVQAAVLAYFLRWELKEAYWKLFGFSLAAFFCHILGDWSTSYGTPLLAPFSWTNHSLDWISNLTFIPMVIFGAALLTAKLKPQYRHRMIFAGWGVFVLFLAVSGGWHARAMHIVGDNAVATLPHPFYPTSWYGIATDDKKRSFEAYNVSLFPPKKELIGRYPSLEHYKSNGMVEKVLKQKEVKTYLAFNRWPVCRVQKEGKLTTVNIGNPLFRWHKEGRLARSLMAEVDMYGNITAITRSTFPPE